jgi:hypothetical protein
LSRNARRCWNLKKSFCDALQFYNRIANENLGDDRPHAAFWVLWIAKQLLLSAVLDLKCQIINRKQVDWIDFLFHREQKSCYLRVGHKRPDFGT